MMNNKLTRVSIGLGLLAVLVMAIAPNLYLFNSVDGVVNGRILVLHTPIAGEVRFAKSVRYGTPFSKGEAIGTVANDRVEESFLHELLTERATLEARAASLEDRIKKYMELSESLKASAARYQEFSARQLESIIRQESHRLAQERAERERAEKEFESSRMLDERRVVPRRELDRHEANLRASQERINQIQSRIEELENSLQAVRNGAFLGDGHNDAPYSKQRTDQLVIEISLAQTARNEALSRIAGIDLQIERERGRLAKAKRYDFQSPMDALVWRMPVSDGSPVVIGSELIVLLDCASVFLDVSVSESQFANIKPGDTVRYRLIGDTRFHQGAVFALRGSGSVQGDINLAASVTKDPKKEFRIWVSVDPGEIELSPENFFQVGRRVEARLPRRWSASTFLRRFVDVF